MIITPCKQKKSGISMMNIFIAIGIVAILTFSGFVGYVSAVRLEPIDKETSVDNSILNFEFSFPPPTITHEKLGAYISISETDHSVIPGEPVLPMKSVKILLPYSKDVKNIEVDKGNGLLLPGEYNITHGQKPIPLNYKGKISLTERNLLIYDSFEPYPGVDFKVVSTQISRGFKVLIVNLFPVQYIPKTGRIYYYPEMNLRIDLCPSGFGSGVLTCRNLPQDVARVESMVDNPEILDTYKLKTGRRETSGNSKGGLVDPADTYEYVIITNETLRDVTGDYTFQTLVQSKVDKGLNATIVTVEEIYANYPGRDHQEQIRNFIIDAYENWETEYVLLGGDGDGADVGGESEDAIIPARGLFAYIYSELQEMGDLIPADLYYGCLDGSFDSNGNGMFGEVGDGYDIDPEHGEVDLFAEVYVGRAPIDSEEELSNFVRKTLAYENTNDSYLENVRMVGEFLFDFFEILRIDFQTFAQPAKDEIKDRIPRDKYNISTLYDYCGGNMKKETLDISAYTGVSDNVRVKFRLWSDRYIQYLGLYIDDVKVTGDDETLFLDDMENGENGWTHYGDGDEWELGFPIFGPTQAHSGINCWGTDLDDKYKDFSNQSLVSPPIDLSDIDNAELSFYRWSYIEEDYDYGFVEISVDDGESWEILGNYTGGGWAKEDLIPILNEGVHVINHLGHSNNFHLMRLDDPVHMQGGVISGPCHDIQNLTNEKYFFLYSQGCFPGAFDNRYDNGSYFRYDCIAERLVTTAHGAFACVVNSRYGIGAADARMGPSQYFDRQFFDALFGENNRSLGIANQNSKEDNIGIINRDGMRYCYYELNLFGDPELAIRDPFLREHDISVIDLDANNYMKVNTTNDITATIHNSGQNLERNITVQFRVNQLLMGEQIISSITSGESVLVKFEWIPPLEGTYIIEINALPVPDETRIYNNQVEKIVYVVSNDAVYACVLDSFGTDLGHGIFDTLNREWENYGETSVVVDYITFNDVYPSITYEKLVNANPDVLIISTIFPLLGGRPFSHEEILAIKKYVEEGHGLIATGDPFAFGLEKLGWHDNKELLPLFGIRADIEPQLDPGGNVENFNVFLQNLPLFRNISNPYIPGKMHPCVPVDDRSWDANDLSSGTYVAKSSDSTGFISGFVSEGVVVVNKGLIYISTMIENSPNTNDLQLLYNAILWSKYNLRPTGLIALPGDIFINLHWNRCCEENVDYYSIYRSTSPDNGFEKIAQTDGTTTFYQDTECFMNATYYYKITASDYGGLISNFSNTVSASTRIPTRGDINNNEVVDVGDIVFLISYLFRNGPEPPILAAADVNADGTLEEPKVDIGDVVYFINYLFRNGPSPGYLDWPNNPPRVNAGSDQIGLVGHTVYFDGSLSCDLDGTIVSYEWDFDDGNSGEGITTTHRYNTTGTYTVTLTVTDDEGEKDNDTCVVYVLPPVHVPEDYSTIQDAINNAIDGRIILVAAGTYVENIDFLGKMIIVKSTDGPEVTIIDGGQSGSVVTFDDGETSTSVLEGFMVTNGSADNGGGIYCKGSSPTITNNYISNNTANSGGGVYCSASTPAITNNTITRNSAIDGYGGGVYFDELSAATIVNNTVSNNTADYYGGGIYCSASVTITSNDILDNIVNKGSGGGIYCSASTTITNNVISNNVANNGCSGIYLSGSSTTTIVDNTFGANGITIKGDDLHHWNTHVIENNTVDGKPIRYYRNLSDIVVPSDTAQLILANCSDSTIQNLNIDNVDIGIQLGYSSHNNISGNTIINNSLLGIFLSASSDNTIYKNNITNNYVGIYLLYDSSNNTISKNTMTNNYSGIYLYGQSGSTILGNTIGDNQYSGIFLDFSSANTISKNIVTDNEDGIYLYKSSGNNISENTFTNNGNDVYLYISSGNDISGNTITKNDYGIRLYSSSDNTISNNNITGKNICGVYLKLSSENIVSGNIITNTSNQGINIYYYSSGNIIFNNSIAENDHGMVVTYRSSGNKIFHNEFIKNNQNAYGYLANIWDDGYPNGGNFWDDYTGSDDFSGPNQTDPGSDRIGDTPYNISGGDNQDRYPLFFPISNDEIPPVISNIEATPGIQIQNRSVNITCIAADNVKVDTVKVNITNPADYTQLNVTMNRIADTDIYYYESNYTDIGTYDYYIWAVDRCGNDAVSEVQQFKILPPPTVDYILITKNPDGDEIRDKTIGTEHIITGYASAYNHTFDYIGLISVNWSVGNIGSDASTDPSTGTSSTFNSGTQNNTSAIWKADDGNGHNDTVVFTIKNVPIYVDDDADPGWYDDIHVKTIGEALEIVAKGQTVFVYNGTYCENIIINKTINLIGESNEFTIINGSGIDHAVQILANQVNISGFILRNSGSCIGISVCSDNNTICKNIIVDNRWGIYLKNSSNNIITSNNITNNIREGIDLRESSNNNVISGNDITNNKEYGVYLYSTHNNLVFGNTISNNNYYNLYLKFSSENNITSNDITNSSYGIFIYDSSDNNITSNDIKNNTFGTRLYYSSNNNIISKNNIINNNENSISISLEGASNTTIIDNTLTSGGITLDGRDLYHWNTHTIENNSVNDKPIYYYKDKDSRIVSSDAAQVILANCSNFTIQNLNNLTTSIQLGYSLRNNISMNNITSNYDGIYLYCSSNNTIFRNSISNCGCDAIRAYKSIDNTISKNTITNNNYGINLHFSPNNTVSGNLIANSSNGYGISLSHSSNSKIFGNNLINNTCDFEIWDASNITVTENTINNSAYGIILATLSNSIISRNTITNTSEYALFLTDSSNNIITNNTITNNQCNVLYIESSSDNTISENNITNNNRSGIYLTHSSYNKISENTITQNKEGIRLNHGSSDNTISENNIIDNDGYGINISDSSNNNEIYHNYLIDNAQNAYDDGDNTWDNEYPSGGNYWSDFDEPCEGAYDDYHGELQDQEGGDNIVDKGSAAGGGLNPYDKMGGGNQDTYPLFFPSPMISNVEATPTIQIQNGSVNITCNVFRVDIVKVDIAGPTGFTPVNTTMNRIADTDIYYYESNYTDIGTYDYYIWAVDRCGNDAVSELKHFEIVIVDYVLITESPGGSEIPDRTIGTGCTVTGYASSYNNTFGYIGPIFVGWSVENLGSDASTDPSTGTSSTFYSGIQNNTSAIWRADDGNGHNDTVVFIIKNVPIYVDDDADPGWYDDTHVKTIGEALEIVAKGQTVFVYNGTYYENFVINKTINLVGQDKDTTIIDGYVRENVVSISAGGVNISGFTIQNSGYWTCIAGIYISSDKNTIIDNNIGNNPINNMAYGILLPASSNNKIIGNNISKCEWDGITGYLSNNNTISDNNITDNNGGIYLDWSCNNNTISGNTIIPNIDTYGNGIYLSYSSNNRIFRNDIKNSYYGVYLSGSNNNLLYHNNFINNTYHAHDDETNFWDNGYPSGGNYWDDFDDPSEGAYDDYHGEYQNLTGGDGIVDLGLSTGGLNPYDKMGGGNQDTYPLISPHIFYKRFPSVV